MRANSTSKLFQPLLYTRNKSIIGSLFIGIVFILLPTLCLGSLDTMKQNLHRFTLDNGMKLLVYTRTGVRTAAVNISVDFGSIDEATGKSGIAHVLEHMSFKGTKTIGTTNYRKELQVLDQIEEALKSLRLAEKNPAISADERLTLAANFESLLEKGQSYVAPNEYAHLLEKAGAEDVNAATWFDSTEYTCVIPLESVPVWMEIEQDRLQNAVFRDLYTELDVILEEWREYADKPLDVFMNKLISLAFQVHAYRKPIIGYEDDIRAVERKDVEWYYHQFMVPENLMAVVVGDVEPASIFAMAQKTLGKIPSSPKPVVRHTQEPEQISDVQFEMRARSQPFLAHAYHVPEYRHPDYMAVNLLTYILGDGKNCRLYKELVKNKQLAVRVESYTYDLKEPQLLYITVTPATATDLNQLNSELIAQLELLAAQGVTQDELAAARKKVKSDILAAIASSGSLASWLVTMEINTGKAEALFDIPDAIDSITPEAIQKVAQKYLVPHNRTIGFLFNENGTAESAEAETEEKDE